jgi:uncharacterized protein YdeI (YjbR/CyaY-like superfamily)
MEPGMRPTYFRTPSALRRWLESHHASAKELWVGYYKIGTGRPSVTWPESVDAALCFGWIDGIRKSLGADRYTIRFTPRKPGSVWSSVNIRKARALVEQGHMRPAGLAAFRARRVYRSGIYSYEQRRPRLEEPYQRLLKQNRAAWEFFQAQTPSYRKAAGWWVVSAKKEETRLKRLEKLIEHSARGRTLPELTPRRARR